MGEDIMHDVTVTKDQKYPSKRILNNANILAEVTKLHNMNIYNITLFKKYTV